MDWKTNQDEESLKNYQELKNLLDNALKKISHISDLRTSKGLLIDVQSSFKGLKLQRENREELYEKLQEAFAEINEKISQERSSFEKEAQYNYADFKIRIEEAQFLASHPREFHETWNHLLEVQSSFKGVKLLREHREELYNGLQNAFDTLKKKQSLERSHEIAVSSENLETFGGLVENMVNLASTTKDLRLQKDEMIKLQTSIRESKLVKEHRDKLLEKLQEAFIVIQIRQDEEFQQTSKESAGNYYIFKPQVRELLSQAETSLDFHLTRESIKALQSVVRTSRLLREQRDELYTVLQEAFTKLSERQDKEQDSFQKEAKDNYERLKLLVEKGLTQAEVTSKYKETREFLKKTQAEFSTVKLLRDHREELYSRLQTAFHILNKRVDEFFREKKKNWMLKMQYKVSESSSEIFILQKNLEKDQNYLIELEDQLEIVILAGKDKEIIAGLKSRISSTLKSIEKKHQDIQNLENTMVNLKNQIEPQESEDSI